MRGKVKRLIGEEVERLMGEEKQVKLLDLISNDDTRRLAKAVILYLMSIHGTNDESKE